MSWSMPGSSSRTQDFDQGLASALGSAVTGVVITTTTGGSATTTAAAFVVGVALSTVVASSIAAVFPAACAGWAVTATTAVATTAAAAVATTTAAAVATTAAAATTGGATAGLRFVDPERTAHQFCTLQAFNGCFFGGLIGHLNEGKTTLATCVPLEGQRAVGHFTELGKQLDHIFLLSAEGKVADKNAHVLRGPGTKQWTDEALNIAIGL